MKLLGCVLMLTLIVGLDTGCRPEIPKRSTARLTLRLVDDNGQAVSEAKVAVVGFHVAAQGKTDSNGCFVATLRTVSGEVDFEADKDGYYSINRQTYHFIAETNSQFYPWNPLVELQFHKAGNPVPMFVKDSKSLRVPVKGHPVGYDLLIGDWVRPYGLGLTNDLILTVDGSITNRYNFASRMVIEFSNPGDGLILRQLFWRDDYDLRLAANAPADGYINRLEFFCNGKFNPKTQTCDVTKNMSQDDNYYFRVRTIQNPDGEALSAMYGKIYHPINFEPGFQYQGQPTITLLYYLNPDGTRNTEFSGSNLCAHPGDVPKGH